MGWVFAALITVVLGFAFLASTGRLGQLAPYVDDRPVPVVPEGRPLTPEDLAGLRFAVVARGYSMPQVDAVLARLAEQLATRPEPAPERSSAVVGLGPSPIGWPRAGQVAQLRPDPGAPSHNAE